MESAKIAIVGEFTPDFLPHARTVEAFSHVRAAGPLAVETVWLSTSEFVADARGRLAGFDGVLVAPGSPYLSLKGALNVIEVARESNLPLLGTCGGCQHIIIEFARRVLAISDAAHAEYDPYASNLFIQPLSCSLVGQRLEVHLRDDRIREIYGEPSALEEYYCNFGLAPEYEPILDRGGLRIVGRDLSGEARIFSVKDHPFFYGTVFVPQLGSRPDRPHPLIEEFVRQSIRFSERSAPSRSDLEVRR